MSSACGPRLGLGRSLKQDKVGGHLPALLLRGCLGRSLRTLGLRRALRHACGGSRGRAPGQRAPAAAAARRRVQRAQRAASCRASHQAGGGRRRRQARGGLAGRRTRGRATGAAGWRGGGGRGLRLVFELLAGHLAREHERHLWAARGRCETHTISLSLSLSRMRPVCPRAGFRSCGSVKCCRGCARTSRWPMRCMMASGTVMTVEWWPMLLRSSSLGLPTCCASAWPGTHPAHLSPSWHSDCVVGLYWNSFFSSPEDSVLATSSPVVTPTKLLASPSELSASPSELLASPSELSASPSELF
jgi:hypothetical protein